MVFFRINFSFISLLGYHIAIAFKVLPPSENEILLIWPSNFLWPCFKGLEYTISLSLYQYSIEFRENKFTQYGIVRQREEFPWLQYSVYSVRVWQAMMILMNLKWFLATTAKEIVLDRNTVTGNLFSPMVTCIKVVGDSIRCMVRVFIRIHLVKSKCWCYVCQIVTDM